MTFLNASQNVIIKDNYCTKQNSKITASFFQKDIKNDFYILDLPSNRSSFSVPSLQIISKLKEHNISYKDLSGGVVKFSKCYDPIDFTDLKKAVRKRFEEKYPSIKISDIDIKETSPLSFDLSSFRLGAIHLSENDYRNSTGVLSVSYARGFKSKTVYLRYKMTAYILVFKAKYNLRNGKILQNKDYEKSMVKFGVLPRFTITGDLEQKYIVRGYVRKGSILTSSDLKIKKSLMKNDFVQAILKNENLVIEVDAHVLNDANIGDIVKIRTVNGKVFKAKILSKNSAMILE